MKEFQINDEWQILTAERDRIIFFNNYTKQLQVITPRCIHGDVVKVYNNILCLSFDLDERLNLNLWREMDSSIYVKDEDKALNYGAVFDLLNTQEYIIQDLEKRNKLLKNLLTIITDLMMERDWKALEKMVDNWEESDRLLQSEWGDCGD